MEEIDFKIVQKLDQNSRGSFASVARALGVSSRTVNRRVTTMIRTGFIRSFDAVVEISSLGLAEAVCDVRIAANAKKEEVRRRMLEIPNLNEIITLVGDSFVVYAYYDSPEDLESILVRLSAIPGVADVQYEVSPRSKEPSAKVSRQSWAIIQSLNHKSRKELASIARETGLSARTVQRNILWLEKIGAIRFEVDVDISKAKMEFIYVLVARLQLGVARTETLEHITRTVTTVWRNLRTVNPHTIILLLHAKQTQDFERDVETIRLVRGVTGVRVLIITGDTRNVSQVDDRIATRASGI